MRAVVTKGSSDPSTLPPVMNIVELCAYLRIHRSTVYRLIKAAQLPYFRIGSDYRFNREVIDRWRRELQEQEGGGHPARTR